MEVKSGRAGLRNGSARSRITTYMIRHDTSVSRSDDWETFLLGTLQVAGRTVMRTLLIQACRRYEMEFWLWRIGYTAVVTPCIFLGC